ncbi:MAG: hypothetical protein HFJ27_03980 [Clostridia bacterium]|nr:hypothetical protein [Clostridia bacterium]
MTRKELEEVFHIGKEIQDLERRINIAEKQSTMASDVVQNGFKRHAVIYGVDVKRVYKLQYAYERLKKFKIMLVDKKQRMENYIESIPFSEIRQIFRYRYIDNKNWVQIAHEMNKLYQNKEYSEGSVRLKHDRYLGKN